MRKDAMLLPRVFLPIGVFLLVAFVHFIWTGLFPEQGPVQERWAVVVSDTEASWLTRYIETQAYWLGYTYALSFSFAAVAMRRYREQRFCAARNFAIGGLTMSGFLAVAGCYLLGCCGSPMLVVYLNLFGAAFLPLAKPLVATASTLMIFGAWWWMNHHRQYTAVSPKENQSTESVMCNDC